jgi:hypothetical protein
MWTPEEGNSISITIFMYIIWFVDSTIAKMDAWVRQGEVWRSDIESQLGDISTQNK